MGGRHAVEDQKAKPVLSRITGSTVLRQKVGPDAMFGLITASTTGSAIVLYILTPFIHLAILRQKGVITQAIATAKREFV